MGNPQEYLISKTVAILSLLSVVLANDDSMADEDVRLKFEEAELLKDLIPVAPKHAMEILYTNRTVKFGNNFTRGDFEKQPTNVQWPTQSHHYYTLIFTDPDCPKRSDPFDKEWQHWIVGNIPGCDFHKGEVISTYIGGLPFYLQYPHRYVFLAYMQPEDNPISFDEPRLDDRPIESDRAQFSTTSFAEKYGLGDPIAGNFFMAGGPEPPEELPELLKRLLTTKSPRRRARNQTTTAGTKKIETSTSKK